MNIDSDYITTCPGCADPKQLHWISCYRAVVNNLPRKEILASPTRNPKFHSALKRMAEMHDKKAADYSHADDPYSNFKEAALTAGITVDEVFMTLIGIKMARLRELLQSGKTPNNESIQDTRLDLAIYSTLLLSFHEDENA